MISCALAYEIYFSQDSICIYFIFADFFQQKAQMLGIFVLLRYAKYTRIDGDALYCDHITTRYSFVRGFVRINRHMGTEIHSNSTKCLL